MGHPELNRDESVLLATQNIVVKSVPFEAILTNERLILVNTRDTLMPPQYLPLAAIMSMDTSENAIRDPTITFSVATETGSTRQMVLTFSRQAGGERKRECDEWAKMLRDKIDEFEGRHAHAEVPASEPEPVQRSPPVSPASGSVQTGKKRIEIARPMKKIIEMVPAPQKPKETISLPQGSFCSRCGSRVPPDSAFCNRCGTRVAAPGDQVPIPVTPTPQEPVVQQVSVTVPNVVTPTQGKERPIEDVIHSIEPLIEDSKPRTQPAPLVPSRHGAQPTSSTMAEKAPPTAIENPDPTKRNLDLFSNILVSQDSVATGGAAADAGSGPAPAGSPVTDPAASFPPAGNRPASGMPKFVTYAVIAIVVVAIILGGFLLTKNGGTGTPAITPVPTAATGVPTAVTTTVMPTATPTPVQTVATATLPPTPAVAPIPQNGVWVHINYAGSFTGSYGTPGNEAEVAGSGDHVYQIPTINGIVVATFTKNDGSADPMIVEVYRNGVLAATEKTSAPKGTAEIQANLKPVAMATLAATPAPTKVVLNGSTK